MMQTSILNEQHVEQRFVFLIILGVEISTLGQAHLFEEDILRSVQESYNAK